VHLDIIKVFIFTNGCTIYLVRSTLKFALKFTLNFNVNFNINSNVLLSKYLVHPLVKIKEFDTLYLLSYCFIFKS